MDKAPLRFAMRKHYIKHIQRQFLFNISAHSPTNNTPEEEVGKHRQVPPTLDLRNVHDIADLGLVESRFRVLTINVVERNIINITEICGFIERVSLARKKDHFHASTVRRGL